MLVPDDRLGSPPSHRIRGASHLVVRQSAARAVVLVGALANASASDLVSFDLEGSFGLAVPASGA